jgi:hypothetical protein
MLEGSAYIAANITCSKYKEYANMSLLALPIGQRSLDNSHINAAELKEKQLHPVQIKWENCVFYVGIVQRICLFSDYFYSDSTLISTTIAVK